MSTPGPVGSLYRRVTTRKAGVLPPHRATRRLSAYVYGNVLVMTVVVAASPSSIANGTAALLVIGTTLTTFLAHIFADAVAAGTVDDDSVGWREELRDSLPIASSGVAPSLLLALAWLDILPGALAQGLAGGLVTLRIASIPVVAERLRGRGLSFRLVLAGIATAVLAAIVVAVKVYLTH